MQVVPSDPKQKEEKQVALSTIEVGGVVRFPECSYEEAVSGHNDNSFYMVIPTRTTDGEKRVRLISLDGRSEVVRDGDRLVVSHAARVQVYKHGIRLDEF